MSELFEAIQVNDSDRVIALLEQGEDPNEITVSGPLLVEAWFNENLDMMDVLLEYGADPNQDDGSGKTVFCELIAHIIQSITGRRPEYEPDSDMVRGTIELLMSWDADPYYKIRGSHKPSPYQYVIDYPTKYSLNAQTGLRDIFTNDVWASEQIRDILLETRQKIKDYKTYQSKKRLAFIRTGMDPGLLSRVAPDLMEDIGERTLDRDYDVDPTGIEDETYTRYDPSQTLQEYKENKRMADFLTSIQSGGLSFQEQFDQVKQGINFQDAYNPENGNSILLYFCLQGNYDVAEKMLDSGADPNHKNKEGMTILAGVFLFVKSKYRKAKTMQVLIDFGADPSPIIRSPTIPDNQKRVIKYLVNFKQRPNSFDKQKQNQGRSRKELA